eukprot:gene23785-28834_t
MGNVPDSNIIMMHYNDLANNNLNPYPGKVFNSIGGPDVYHKTWADYSGGDVTASNFLAALQQTRGAAAGNQQTRGAAEGNQQTR